MDDRVTRLMDKAEKAADAANLDQAETYRVLADQAAYHARKEARAIEKIWSAATPPSKNASGEPSAVPAPPATSAATPSTTPSDGPTPAAS